MKKIVAVLLSVSMLLAMASCGKKETESKSESVADASSSVEVVSSSSEQISSEAVSSVEEVKIASALNKEHTTECNILCVGDSLTFGISDDGGKSGWRYSFIANLYGAGCSFKMVGASASNDERLGKDFLNHSGVSGWRIASPLYNPNYITSEIDCDVIVLFLGRNDYNAVLKDDNGVYNTTSEKTLNENLSSYKQVLNKLYDQHPDVTIFCVNIIPKGATRGDDQGQLQWNPALEELVKTYSKENNRDVRYVDLCSYLTKLGWTTADYSADNLHPNEHGYDKMGKGIAESLKDFVTEFNKSGSDYSSYKRAADPKSVTLNKSEITLKPFNKETLTATVDPSDSYFQGLIWTSSDEKIATVNNLGKVVAQKGASGTCTITATAAGGAKATCKVTVQ